MGVRVERFRGTIKERWRSKGSPLHEIVLAAALAWAATLMPGIGAAAARLPERIEFEGPDGVELVGYLFHPDSAGRHPAIVMLHGRAGPYSTAAHGVYDATTLSKRHVFWGETWADQGYVAFLVDSFGPRGYAAGFQAHSYDERPDAVSEVTVRPRDAYAALVYLRTRADVDGSFVALQGWSNGGSATLATMADITFDAQKGVSRSGFVGALAFYPACGLKGAFDERYKPYAPVRVFSGSADEEVSSAHCDRLVEASRAIGGDIDIMIYPGATHDFDDPGERRQSVDANAEARSDAVPRAVAYIDRLFARRARSPSGASWISSWARSPSSPSRVNGTAAP